MRTAIDQLRRTPGLARLSLALLALGTALVLQPAAGHAQEEVPGHVQAVTAALKMRLEGASDAEVEAALGVRGGAAVETEPGFRYEGFALHRVVYADYAPPRDAALYHSLAGYLQFADRIDRRATVAFRVSYDLGKGGPAIGFAALQTATPDEPEAEVFFVPAEAMTTGAGAEGAAAFHDHVARNAVPAFAMAEAAGKSFWTVIFLKDRLEADAAIAVVTSESEEGAGGDGSASRYLLEDGWVTAILANPRGPSGKPPRFAKIIYTPGIGTPEAGRTARPVAVFPLSPD
ncbi:MAG: hypothetical protein HOH66_10805 [Rhodospirillaceae bacterium]|jgi:hypothetical protein|nr:hypothetical protein [Rhodospirillaceae bacterium]